MVQANVILDLVLIVIAATAGGVVALWLKQPVIIGYLLAGIVVGPFTPGPEASLEGLRFLAEIGVGLLLFVVGTGSAPSKFRQVGPVVLLGGLGQVALTILLGEAMGPLLGLDLRQGVFLGLIIAQSSSVVIVKVLEDRREEVSLHGRIALGVTIVQDLSSVPLLLILLTFFGAESNSLAALPLALGKILGLTAGTFILGRLLWGRILEVVAKLGHGELTLLVSVALALGGALTAESLGLSFAVGAFIAGLVLAESAYREEAIRRILPLRDLFAALFFVSIGALFDPGAIVHSPLRLLALVGAAIIGKAVVSTAMVAAFRYPLSTALLSGLLLAQIGEFAFILANIGLDRQVLSETLFALIIGAAIVSIAANSLVLDSAPSVEAFLARVTRFRPLARRRISASATERQPTRGIFRRRDSVDDERP